MARPIFGGKKSMRLSFVKFGCFPSTSIGEWPKLCLSWWIDIILSSCFGIGCFRPWTSAGSLLQRMLLWWRQKSDPILPRPGPKSRSTCFERLGQMWAPNQVEKRDPLNRWMIVLGFAISCSWLKKEKRIVDNCFAVLNQGHFAVLGLLCYFMHLTTPPSRIKILSL